MLLFYDYECENIKYHCYFQSRCKCPTKRENIDIIKIFKNNIRLKTKNQRILIITKGKKYSEEFNLFLFFTQL